MGWGRGAVADLEKLISRRNPSGTLVPGPPHRFRLRRYERRLFRPNVASTIDAEFFFEMMSVPCPRALPPHLLVRWSVDDDGPFHLSRRKKRFFVIFGRTGFRISLSLSGAKFHEEADFDV